MEEINYSRKELNKITVYNKGGFESKILLFDDNLLIKAFEPYLKGFIDFERKKLKLVELNKRNLNEEILLKPLKLVNVDGRFEGYIMHKIDDSITIDNVRNFNKLIKFYKILFEQLDYLHAHDIVVGDVKHHNILVKDDSHPIFIDVDSMGIGDLPVDHSEYLSRTTKMIPNISKKIESNDEKEIDKLKLLSCFVNSVNDKGKTITENLFNSKLSDNFKQEIYKILTTNENLDISNVIHDLFYEEEKLIQKGGI